VRVPARSRGGGFRRRVPDPRLMSGDERR
jgi:hypothetical protein